MSFEGHEGATAVHEPETEAGAPLSSDACRNCGAHLAEDQEWCLECGTARTVIHRAPGWRYPIAVVGGVIALALLAFAVALTLLSGSANRIASASLATTTAATKTVTVSSATAAPASPAASAKPATTQPLPAVTAPRPANTAANKPATRVKTVTVTTTAPAASTPAPSSSSKTVSLSGWPPGLGGWTVVMYSSKVRADAYTVAHTLQASVANLGVLNSGDHPSMAPGAWVVFSGRYPTQSAAKTAAETLKAEGYAKAHARMVEPPGGN